MGLFSKNKKADVPETKDAAGKTDATAAASQPPVDMSSMQRSASPPDGKASGQAEEQKPDLSAEDARKHAMVGKKLAAAFGELVTLVLRSEADRKRPISDLEWMIAPAIATGQFAIADAQSKKTGAISPIGAVLWAMVSEDVDRKLSDTNDQSIRLKPEDWRSGSIPWIVLAMGDKRVVAGLIKRLTQDVFKDQAPKIRSRNDDGVMIVGRVQLSETPEQPN